jgi:uncharacterized damage-inducible protein DinB
MPTDELANRLVAARHELLAAFERFPASTERTRPAPDEWSALEVLGHIAEADYFYLQQALMGRNLLVHALEYFDDVRWRLEHPDPAVLDRDEVMRRLSAAHRSCLAVLDALGPAERSRSVAHRRGITYTVGDVFSRIADHDHAHAAQLKTIATTVGPGG